MGVLKFFLLAIFTIFFVFFVIAKQDIPSVDSRIAAVIEESGDVDVIVLLNEPQATVLSADRVRVIDASEKSVISTLSLSELKLKHKYSTMPGFAGKINKGALQKLSNNPSVKAIVLDQKRSIDLSDSVPLVNSPNLWTLIYNSSNITGDGESVCIVDTGVNYSHPDMGGCTSASFAAGTCDKVPSGYDYVNTDADPADDHSHGTHVAGIVASTNSTYKGVAPGARIIALKACDSGGSCSDSDITASIDWCVANYTRFNISVISMSLGGGSYSSFCDSQEVAFASSIEPAIALNISVVASSGNSGSTSLIAAPACIKNVTSVGSTTKSDGFSSFSNRNNITDLLAPGSSITSLDYQGTFKSLSGTSMAAPHVAGAFALLRQFYRVSYNKTLTPQKIQEALNFTGKDVNDSGGNGVTYKRMDVYQAMLYLDPSLPNLSVLSPANNSVVAASRININFSSNKSVFYGWLEFNNTNYSMTRLNSTYFTFSKDNLTNGNNTVKIFANNSWNDIAVSQLYLFIINNSAPFGNSSFNVSSAYLNDTISIGALLNASDPDADAFGFSYRWFNQSGVIPNSNSTNLSSSNWTRNSNLTFEATVMDGSLTAVFNSSYIVVGNSAPVGNSSFNLSSVSRNVSAFGVQVNFSDADYDNVSLSFRWFNQSGIIPGQNLTNLSFLNWSKGDSIIFESTLNDGTAITVFNTSQQTISNSAPFMQTQNAFYNASAGRWFLVYANVTDNDGASDIVNTSVSSSNGSCSQVSNTSSGLVFGVLFNCTASGKLETRLSISFNDSNSSSVASAVSNNVFPNLPPLGNSSINLSSASKNISSLGAIVNASDPDNEALLFSFRWFNQSGLITAAGSSNLSSSFWLKGDSITFETNVSDNYSSVVFNSTSLVVYNSNPFHNYIGFENASSGHWFLVYANVTDLDGSADIVNASLNTTLGSCSYLSNTSSGNIFGVLYNCSFSNSSLTNISFSFNDSSSFMVQVNGSNVYPNNLPSASQVNISPLPASISDLTCNYGFADLDGDIDNGTSFRWFNDSGLISATNNTVFSGNFSVLDNITCEVMLGDGLGFGNKTNSSTISIGDLFPPLLFNATESETSVTQGSVIRFRVNVSENLSSMNYAYLETENPNGVKVNYSMALISANYPNSSVVYEYNFTSVSPTGSWYARFYSADRSGNIGNTSARNLSFSVNAVASPSSTPSGSSSSGGGGGGGGGGTAASSSPKAVYSFTDILPSNTNVMKISNPSIPVNKVQFILDAEVKGLEITVEPSVSPQLVVPDSYQYFTATPSKVLDVESVQYDFQVNKSWLADKGYSKEWVRLQRFSLGKWAELPTSIINESQLTYSFRALSPGFSLYAITASAPKPVATQGQNISSNVSNQTSLPETSPSQVALGENVSSQPFEKMPESSSIPSSAFNWLLIGAVIFAFAVLFAAVLIFRKRQES